MTPTTASRRFVIFDRSALPLLLFAVLYIAIAVAISSLPGEVTAPRIHWTGLLCALASTGLTMLLYDRRFLDLGLFLSPSRAACDLVIGMAWAAAMALTVDALIQISGGVVHRSMGDLGQINAGEIWWLFVPAVLHEELLFRGYPFQKLLLSSRSFAIFFGSAVFALAHMGNRSATTVGLINVFGAGVILSLAFVWTSSLWVPIGLHFGWNFVTGPILGHEVSGYTPATPFLSAVDRGPALVSGGSFGIEGSLWVTVLEVAAVVLLSWRIAQNRPEQRFVGRVME